MKTIKNQLINFLKGKAVKAALKKLLGSVAAGGFAGFIITYVVEHLFEELAVPVINLVHRKGLLIYDKRQGKIIVGKIEEAKEQENEEDYLNSIGRV